MPKIILTNSETGKDEEFEPVDAREILRQENTIYSASEEGRKMVGLPMQPGPGSDQVNIPQLQGDDAEMQTGLSIEKYGRSAVVKAVPGSPEFAPPPPPPQSGDVSAGAGTHAKPGSTTVSFDGDGGDSGSSAAIPENWREMQWKQRVSLGSKFSSEPVRNAEDADRAIQAEVDRRATADA